MKLDTAVVLAGGAGTRLNPLTNEIPKGMIKVCNKPILEWIIEWLKEMEVKNIVIGVAYQKNVIIDYFKNGKSFDVDITYSVHSVEGGTSEGFRLAIDRFVNENTFFAMNGDQITDLNLNELAEFHSEYSPIATLAVSNPNCPYGHVILNNKNDVTGFIEKPSCTKAFCSTGVYVFNRKILEYLQKQGDVEKTVFPVLADMGKLKAYLFHDFFTTINTVRDLIDAEKELMRRYK